MCLIFHRDWPQSCQYAEKTERMSGPICLYLKPLDVIWCVCMAPWWTHLHTGATGCFNHSNAFRLLFQLFYLLRIHVLNLECLDLNFSWQYFSVFSALDICWLQNYYYYLHIIMVLMLWWRECPKLTCCRGLELIWGHSMYMACMLVLGFPFNGLKIFTNF